MSTPLHNCFQTQLEIEYFKEKLTEFFIENKRLKSEITNLEKAKCPPQKVDSSCQTKNSEEASFNNSNSNNHNKLFTKIPIYSSNPRCLKCISKSNASVQTKATNTFDADIYNQQNKKSYVKLCEMHHKLLKKLEEEVNESTVKQDLINHMKIEMDQLEAKCIKYENQIESMHTKIEIFKDIELKNKKLSIELESYRMKCQKYKNELKCFDEKFFEEIKDLKHKYSEAVKLNKNYENILIKRQEQYKINDKKGKNHVKFALDNNHDYEKEYLNNDNMNNLDNLFDSNNKNTKESIDMELNSLDLSDLININNELNKTEKKDDIDLDSELGLNDSIDIEYLIDQTGKL